MSTVVVKIGTSSVIDGSGALDDEALAKLCGELAQARTAGHQVVLVASGAVAAGLPALGYTERPNDEELLYAIAAVGQPFLMSKLSAILKTHGITTAQVLLTPNDFGIRSQFLHVRSTFQRLLKIGVLPIVNENDPVASSSIRYGDNDRIAALCAHLIGADLLLLLTDTAGLFTADPRLDGAASLIEEVAQVDAALEAVAGAGGSERGSGGMTSKVAAAKIATWSGVQTVIAGADTKDVVQRACAGEAVGTKLQGRSEHLTSRKLWIAFARGSSGRIVVDDGAKRALLESGKSLLAAGVRAVEGHFEASDAVEVLDLSGDLIAKGVSSFSADDLRMVAGKRSSDIPDGLPTEAIHRDDLVILA